MRNIAGVAGARNFYKLPGVNAGGIEDYLGRIESRFAPARDKLLRYEDLGTLLEDERRTIAYFAATQFVRTLEMASAHRLGLDDANDERLRAERTEMELDRTRYERKEIQRKLKALEKPEDEFFLSGMTFEECVELIEVLPPEKIGPFFGLGDFFDDALKKKPKERRKAVASLLKMWPPPVPSEAKIFREGMEMAISLEKLGEELGGKAGGENLPAIGEEVSKALNKLFPAEPIALNRLFPAENKLTFERKPTVELVNLTVKPTLGVIAAGGSVTMVLSVVGVAEPIEFHVNEAPEGTEAGFVRPKDPGPKGLLEVKAILRIPKFAQSGTYKMIFEARGADKRSAIAQYSLTVLKTVLAGVKDGSGGANLRHPRGILGTQG